jgi:hypothetical protein
VAHPRAHAPHPRQSASSTLGGGVTAPPAARAPSPGFTGGGTEMAWTGQASTHCSHPLHSFGSISAM